MKTQTDGSAVPLVPWRQAPFVFLLLAFAILAVTWPWARHFASGTLAHWDPPFHAWKLEFVARTLLSGHLLPPDGNTNMYYPHSGTLYYEALHWPQALLAAALFGCTNFNSLLVYHIVLVFFWALSGLCFWMLLHALGATRRAALLGALFFTLMPYRISYIVEFNMQLNFGLPLFFFFLVRFFQRPSIRTACGMAVAFWLQAASELYQAVFLLFILPFPALALLAARPRLLLSGRRFWLPALAAAVLGGILAAVLLAPYLTLLQVHAVNRNLQEIATHVLEPFSYLRPGGAFHLLPAFDARADEMVVYPTLAMLLLAGLHVFFEIRRLVRLPASRLAWILRAIRWISLLAFAVLVVIIYARWAGPSLAPALSILPVVATLVATALLLLPTERNISTRFMAGLCAAATFAFFMSFGPCITIRHALFGTDNSLYLWIYKHIDALQGFRVVSRFSLYVLIALAAAAALGWSRLERLYLRRPALRALWLVPLLLAVLESWPRHSARVYPLELPYSTPVLQTLDAMDQPYVLAVVPMGQRAYDSRHMLQIARTDRLFVYAWGGAYPRYTAEVRDALSPASPDPAEAARLLRQLWPECFILVDKPLAANPVPPLLPGPALKKWHPCDFPALLGRETDVIAEDDRFALLRLRQSANASSEKIRLVRHDYLEANPLLTFRARVPHNADPVTLWLDLNGYVAARWEIDSELREFEIALPSCYFLNLLPNRLRFHADGDARFYLGNFTLGPAGDTPPPLQPESLTTTCLPWLGHIHDVPSSAIPAGITFRNGFSVVAAEPLVTSAPPGGILHLRYYVRCPRDLRVAVGSILRTRLQPASGRWIEAGVSLADSADLQDVQCQIHPGLYALDQEIPIPSDLPPGDYTLSLLLRDTRNKRIPGHQNGKHAKLFPLPIPIRILPLSP